VIQFSTTSTIILTRNGFFTEAFTPIFQERSAVQVFS